jgi:hypothetical protein
MRTLMLIAIAVLSVPSCTRYMHDGRRGEAAYHAHAARHHHHHGRDREAPCDRDDDARDGTGVIGLAIGRADDSPRGVLVVERVARGGPADDANIRPGDRIVEVEGESTQGMTEAEAARLIRGRVDTAVEIRVESPRGDRIISLVRVAPSSAWAMEGHRHGTRRPCEAKKRGTHRSDRDACDKRECHKHRCDKHRCDKHCCDGHAHACDEHERHHHCRDERAKKSSRGASGAPCASRAEKRAMVEPQHDGDDEADDERGDR